LRIRATLVSAVIATIDQDNSDDMVAVVLVMVVSVMVIINAQ
jgi:hypothetical protein